MQADEKIGLMRALAGKSSAQGHCDKYQTIAQSPVFPSAVTLNVRRTRTT